MQLVYYNIGKDLKYLDLLSLSIESLRKFGNYTGDILVIADTVTCDAVKELKEVTAVMQVDKAVESYQAALNKLKIYKYQDISKYTKILYLDMDILVQHEVQPMFNRIDKISVGAEVSLMCDDGWFGSYLMTEPQIARCKRNNIRGINSGTIGIDINYLSHMKHMEAALANDPRINRYAEQATVNHYLLCHSNIYDTRFNPYICLFVDLKNYQLNKDKTILHFCGGIGEYDRKIKHMRDYYRRMSAG